MATHFSVLAWRIPGTGEPGGLPSLGSHRVGHDWSDLAAVAAAVISYVTYIYITFFVCLKHNIVSQLILQKGKRRVNPWDSLVNMNLPSKTGAKQTTKHYCVQSCCRMKPTWRRGQIQKATEKWSSGLAWPGWGMPTLGLVTQDNESPHGSRHPESSLSFLEAKSTLTHTASQSLFVTENMYAWESCYNHPISQRY